MARALLRAAAVGLLIGVGAAAEGDRPRSSGAGGVGPASGAGGGFEESLLIVAREGWRTDFSRREVALIEFRAGGPGRDGISDLEDPRVTTVNEASAWLDEREPVIEVVVDGAARAYPIQILVWHEVVNDTLAGRPILVTYCPLCNSALAFDRRVDSRPLSFGTTGNLRDYNLVMYDRETESWWQQLDGTAVVGELAGARLPPLAAPLRAWGEFARDHPEGTVLSRRTGHRRPYGSNPYVALDRPRRSEHECGVRAVLGNAATCPVSKDRRLPARERVILIERNGDRVAVPFAALARAGEARLRVGGEPLEASWRPGQRSPFPGAGGGPGKAVGTAEVRLAETGERVPASTPFWFAVAAANPGIRIWSP